MRLRKDTRKDRSKVISYALKNPTDSIRTIARETNVPFASVQRYLREFKEEGKRDYKTSIISNRDFDILQKSQQIIMDKLDDVDEVKRMDAYRVAQLSEVCSKRFEMMNGKNQDQDGGNMELTIKIEWAGETTIDL